MTQSWLATGTGVHTLVVRAFNVTNAAGEAFVPIAVNPHGGTPSARGPAVRVHVPETATGPTPTTTNRNCNTRPFSDPDGQFAVCIPTAV